MELIECDRDDEWLVSKAYEYECNAVRYNEQTWLDLHNVFSFQINLASCMAQQLHAIRLGLAHEVS